MSVEKGAIFDEAKKSMESCRLVAKVVDGGAGFQKINCCHVELTAEDFDCKIKEIYPGGDHEIFLCEVVDAGLGDGKERLYYQWLVSQTKTA